jgi:phosphotransferase system enzyme I (PtsP)
MVLAELAAGGELVATDELLELDIAPQRPERIKGLRFAEGLALGRAVLHERPVAPERLLA